MVTRSERRLCEQVHLDFEYRWFCRLGRADSVPTGLTVPRNPRGASGTERLCGTSSNPFYAAV
ncbi:transposase [Burkholderia latens]|uniref:transposase n=1 Tax=Burkholderia latens TaxID=488446 RepID=UPI001AE995F5|nr:transposase [Burkholderia latens]